MGSWYYSLAFIKKTEYHVCLYTCRLRNAILHTDGYCAFIGGYIMNKEAEEILKRIPHKNYAHFDLRISMRFAWNYVTDSEKIIHHHFYPFIYYEKDYTKYNKNTGIQPKNRPLCYSAHIDRCIYQYYAYLLNTNYNELSIEYDISEVAVAYRNNLKKNNIHFAKQAIDFIRNQKSCYILVGDFTSFFDSLSHSYLKAQLCKLLKCRKLPNDYYAVFKNITKYSSWNLNDLLTLNNLKDTTTGRRSLNKQKRVLAIQQFRDNKHQYLKRHKETQGIPQGSAISAVLANIYMLDFDKHLNNYVKSYSGLYMRYSDDFIIILPEPNQKEELFKIQYKTVCEFINNTPNLSLEPKKTQIFKYGNTVLKNCNADFIPDITNGKNILNYLGFSFDGKTVSVRDKTISKYYYRMYKKIKTILKNNGFTPKKNRISFKKLYLKYSIRGSYINNSNQNKDDKSRGNFLTYINRAKKIFGENENIDRSTKKHMQKICKKLDPIKESAT